MPNLNEDTLAEQPVLDWLKELGYEYAFGPDIAPGGSFMERTDYREVVLESRLKRALRRINPDIPEEKLTQAADQLIKYNHQDLELGNKEMFEWLTRGVKVEIKDKHGELRGDYVNVIDFKNPQNNEFLAVNQFSVQHGNSVRIPDVVVFINGIPVAIFELKSPTRENATVVDAYAQIHETYKKEIPKIFFYNQVLVVSDLLKAKHGTVSSNWDFFTPWKDIESENEKGSGKSELELLTKGIFHKTRFLDIIENFIIFEADAEKDATKFTKKMCMYHQYFGVNRAVDKTLKAVGGDKKIGVFWHTQGSGKSLSMVFYVNKIKKLEALNGPTFLFLTDRNDLDQQFYKTFLRTGYPTAKQAESIRGLADKLKGAGAEVLFTTIQKFEMKEPLSARKNIIVIADEAHRSQYATLAGNVRDVLPNASFMGITGTPVELSNKNTRMVFGDHVSQYPIDRSVDDGTTVPIYYEGRLTPLHLLNDYIDEDFDQLVAEHPVEMKDMLKKKWARLEAAVGADDRLHKIAQDIVYHFQNRGIEGKAMVVTMSRRIAVRMYQIISNMKDTPKTAVIISGNLDYKDQIQKELDNKELEKRFKNPEDQLKIAVVCDMWLTGFDIPCLHTMYLDKALKGHTLMQAIARVNRRYKDKEGGLVVDYIGVADNLKKALAIYTSDIQKQAMVPVEEIIEKMLERYGEVKEFFVDIDYKDWKKLPSGEIAILFSKAVNMILTDSGTGNLDPEKKKRYLQLSGQLYKLFSLAMPHKQANEIRDNVEFFEGVRKAIVKSTIIDPIYVDPKTESAIRDLITKNIAAEGVIDIFAQRGKDKPDISILDEKFLKDVKDSRFKNLTIEAIRKLLNDELRMRMRTNLVRYQSLLEMLEEIIEEYENNIISSSKVIERLIELAKEIKKVEQAGVSIGLTEEEMAFYDSLSQGKKALKNGALKELVKELVKTIRKDIAIDWTNHEIIKARIRADVRMVLLRHDVSYDDMDILLNRVYEQAEHLYKNYPMTFA
ncbi:MAG: Type I site-specific deoxyribonuclease, HsdR family [Candidatus Curtissbacteria bacterium GW2011_GWA1_40_16]|uniref:Type I restriction enzyme endonuclease subunit n=1 Tax=Candidatus Curtissbacteria bacterium GW2011_GWA1_40_16 TaxID=1618405 RepID=A0A0G0TS85_9BACT|nr:MAG: Type I site-specific deoxyribonuclease, HsdR family [Candidatus Curtissbacteria bacterium GW2011_GWA1_40_16]